MANEILIRVRAQDDASKTFDAIGQKANGLGATLGKVGTIASGFLAANVIAGAGQKFIGFFQSSTQAASDLGESMNAVNKIFGDSQQKILDWGTKSANSFGLSQRAFNQMAVPLGASLRNAGLDMDTVADKTIELTERAADMASVFNTDVEDALAAIQAGLRGEADPLERFGVGLSAAKVEAKALAMTGKTLASSLTEQEKALARVELIMEQTNSTAGDFAQTSDQAANAARIQKARQEELAATIGEKLLPIQLKITEAKLKFVELVATKVVPLLEELYAKHWPAVERAISKVVDFIQENWPTISKVLEIAFEHYKTIFEGMVQRAEGFVQVITGVVKLVDAVIHGEWSQAWEAMKQIATGAMDIIIGTVKSTLGSLPEIMLGLATSAGEKLLEGFGNLKDGVTRLFSGVVEGAISYLRDAVNRLISIVNAAIDAYNQTAGHVAGKIDRIDPVGPSQGSQFAPQGGGGGEFATGLSYVPFDRFPAMLHRGERVLTAGENRAYTTQNNQRSLRVFGNVNVYGDSGGRRRRGRDDLDMLLGRIA